ncbi:MAG: hypothetical protein A6F72_00025 [Cycloclasticus sp. symbiont of Poecilosclerida sp. N]|nr:MAG: hypothetical protein A6F72_00025 [Cycloclasticus sp. symbiont of Poecilosclerida sp. N]
MMSDVLQPIKTGLALVFLALIFGLSLGVSFGVNEEFFKEFVAQGIAENPEVHDVKSQGKIWRYAQRAHFHSMGIAAFSIGLLLLVAFSSLKSSYKKLVSILIGLGGLYPLAWLSMFNLAPSIGRGAAHSHIATELLAYLGVGSLLTGLTILILNLFTRLFSEIETST